MIGHKLKAITQYLLDKGVSSSEQFDSVIENARLDLSSVNQGNGMVIGYFIYDATIFIERFSNEPALLFAHVSSWLQTNDDNRESLELEDPTIDIDNPTTKTADVEINIPFSEEISLIQDDNGDIDFNGTTWSIAPVPVDIANEVGVGDSTERDTDATYSN